MQKTYPRNTGNSAKPVPTVISSRRYCPRHHWTPLQRERKLSYALKSTPRCPAASRFTASASAATRLIQRWFSSCGEIGSDATSKPCYFLEPRRPAVGCIKTAAGSLRLQLTWGAADLARGTFMPGRVFARRRRAVHRKLRGVCCPCNRCLSCPAAWYKNRRR